MRIVGELCMLIAVSAAFAPHVAGAETATAPFVKSFSVADSDGAVVSVLGNGPVERYTGEYWLAPGDAEIFADK